jgi:hypothetical protein
LHNYIGFHRPPSDVGNRPRFRLNYERTLEGGLYYETASQRGANQV